MMKDLIHKNRSYRRFYEEVEMKECILEELVDLARLSPSGANLQPLKYMIFNEKEINHKIFKTLKWAGYLVDWEGPEEGERPSAYIVMLGDTTIKKEFACDSGIAAQSILLGAVEKEFGGCILGAINKEKLRSELNIADVYDILLVIALGKPKEKIILEELKEGSVRYWRDTEKVHHVPKRRLEEIIVDFKNK